MDSQAHGSSSGVGRKWGKGKGDGEWLPAREAGSHCSGPELERLGGVWGLGDARRQRDM